MNSGFVNVLVFLIVGACFLAVTLFMSGLVRRSNPGPEKSTTYECGEEPVGSAWVQFNIRFYVVALIFIVFDVEVVFLFPWAVVFKSLGLFAFVEMMIFVAVLLVGLAYVWRKGDLEWVKPESRHKNWALRSSSPYLTLPPAR